MILATADDKMKRLRVNNPQALRADFCNLISFVPARSRDAQDPEARVVQSRSNAASPSGAEVKEFYEKLTTNNETKRRETSRCFVQANSPVQKKRTSEPSVLAEVTVDSRKEMEFLRNAEQGQIDRVKDALARGMPVNTRDQYGWTALMCACYAGQLPVVRLLVEAGANAELCDSRGRTAAKLAGKRGFIHIIKVLTNAESSSSSGEEDGSSRDENPNKDRSGALSSVAEEERAEVKQVYCEDCKETVVGDPTTHFTSILHLLNHKRVAKGPDYFLQTANKGYQLMVKHGWDEERGLGPQGQGMKYPVKTVLKRDRKGIGCEQKDKPKVTHFSQKDTSAVESVFPKSSTRRMNVRTLSKRAQKAKDRRDKAWEIELRRYMNTE